MSDRRRFEGKKVLVTGSGTGIGRGIALEFAREGADVALHYAHSDAGSKSAAEEIVAMGRKATVIKASFEDVDEGRPARRGGHCLSRWYRLPSQQCRHHVQ
jgi:NAD(P)-dependent dehydrogenase (short-subunit alcohol dehydrogenase family)